MNPRPTALLTLIVCLSCSKPEDHAFPSVTSPTEGHPSASSSSVSTPSASTPRAAPDVTFVLGDGFRLSLAALKGKVVAIVVCPAIDAPGCVRESQGLARRWHELAERHVTAVGVVPKDNAQYRAAVARRNVPFDFAADVDGQVSRALGTAGWNADPTTFLVDRDGVIQAIWRTSDPETHARELIAAAERAGGAER